MRALLDKELGEAARPARAARAPVGGRGRRVGATLPRREGLQPGARGSAAQARGRAPLPGAARGWRSSEQTIPEGDQFLFVERSPGVRGSPSRSSIRTQTRGSPRRDGDGRARHPRAARSGRGDGASVQFALADATIATAVAALEPRSRWPRGARRAEVLETPGRAVLAKAEYRDGSTATRTAERLAARLERSAGDGGRASADLVELLASRLHVLDSAVAGVETGDPFELSSTSAPPGPERPSRRSPRGSRPCTSPGGRSAGWTSSASRPVPARGCSPCPGSGAGGSSLPRPACTSTRRARARRRHPGGRPRDGQGPDRGTHPRRARGRDRTPGGRGRDCECARGERRRAPISHGASPLVRDAVRGYRTGHLDRVLGGGFDLG